MSRYEALRRARSARSVIVLVLLLWSGASCDAQRRANMQGTVRGNGFGEKIGIAAVPRRPATTGLAVAWRELPEVLMRVRPGVRVSTPRIVSVGDDAGMIEFALHAPDGTQVARFNAQVFTGGQAIALAQLSTIGDANSMITSPYERPRLPLGDVAAGLVVRGAMDAVMWVYGNAWLQIVSPDGDDVLDLAVAAQRFLDGHLVNDLPTRIPSVARIEVAPQTPAAGDTIDVTLHLTPGQPAVRWEVQASRRGPLALRGEPVRAKDRIVVRVEAREAGSGEVMVTLFDPESLLTRTVAVPLRVRAAP
jgi:hypothetical protein